MRDYTGIDVQALPRSITVAKRGVAVSVAFAGEPGFVETLEGMVAYSRGDAILTGVRGEQWPVRRKVFLRTYAAIPPSTQGEDGMYRKVFLPVRAIRLEEEARVTIAGGELNGKPGDWLLQYGEGEYGIVAADIFARTYAPVV